MSNIITTNDGTQYRTPSMLTTAGAVMVGSTAQSALSLPMLPVSDFAIKKMNKLNANIDTVAITKGMNEALELSGLKVKGAKIFKYSPKKDLSIGEIVSGFFEKMTKIVERNPKPTKPVQPVKILNNLMKELIKYGQNAGYNPDTNAVYINMKKMGTSAFHEMGHAINFNSSKFWKGMQVARLPLMILGGLIPTIALCKRKKVEGEEPKNVFDKVTTFIKENVGKLTTLTFVPIIAEELKATARGNKLAKQVLTPDLAKAVVKTNRYGALTYVLSAVGAGVAAYAANKVKDAIAKPEQI